MHLKHTLEFQRFTGLHHHPNPLIKFGHPDLYLRAACITHEPEIMQAKRQSQALHWSHSSSVITTPSLQPCIRMQSFKNQAQQHLWSIDVKFGIPKSRYRGKPPNTTKTHSIQPKPYGCIILWASMHGRMATPFELEGSSYLALAITHFPVTNHCPRYTHACKFICGRCLMRIHADT